MPEDNWSAEEKEKIVLAGLRNEASVAELCRRYGPLPTVLCDKGLHIHRVSLRPLMGRVTICA